MKRRFETAKEAVFAACEELGTRTSVQEVMDRANQLYVGEVSYQMAVIHRLTYRKEHGESHINCSTYDGQPRRNMLNDARTDLPQVKRLRYFLVANPTVTPDKVLALIGATNDPTRFHSLDQLEIAFKELAELQLAAA